MIERTRSFVVLLVVGVVLGAAVTTTLAKASISDGKVVRWVEKTVAER